MSKKLIDQMVDRFLCWKLPQDFCPDGGITFLPTHGFETPHWPIGTNLLTAEQAKQMISEVVQEDEEVLSLMESTANMLRGMTLDPAIPVHAKDPMRLRVVELEAAIESRING